MRHKLCLAADYYNDIMCERSMEATRTNQDDKYHKKEKRRRVYMTTTIGIKKALKNPSSDSNVPRSQQLKVNLSFRFAMTLFYIYSSILFVVVVFSLASHAQTYRFAGITSSSFNNNNNDKRDSSSNSRQDTYNCDKSQSNCNHRKQAYNNHQRYENLQKNPKESQQNNHQDESSSIFDDEQGNLTSREEPCQDCLAIPLLAIMTNRQVNNGFQIHRRDQQEFSQETNEKMVKKIEDGQNNHHNAYGQRNYAHDNYSNYSNYNNYGPYEQEEEYDNKQQRIEDDNDLFWWPHSDENCPMTGPLTVCEQINSYPADEILHKVHRAKEALKHSYFNIDSLFSDEREHSNEPFEDDSQFNNNNKQQGEIELKPPNGVIIGENSSYPSSSLSYEPSRHETHDTHVHHPNHYIRNNRELAAADEFVDLVEKQAIRLDSKASGTAFKPKESNQLNQNEYPAIREEPSIGGEVREWRRGGNQKTDDEKEEASKFRQETGDMFVSSSANIAKPININKSNPPPLQATKSDASLLSHNNNKNTPIPTRVSNVHKKEHVVVGKGDILLLLRGEEVKRSKKPSSFNQKTQLRGRQTDVVNNNNNNNQLELPKIPGARNIVETAKAYSNRRRHIKRLRRFRRQVSNEKVVLKLKSSTLDTNTLVDISDIRVEAAARGRRRQRRQEAAEEGATMSITPNDDGRGAINSSTTTTTNSNNNDNGGANTDSIDEQSVVGNANQIEPACKAKSIYISPRAAVSTLILSPSSSFSFDPSF